MRLSGIAGLAYVLAAALVSAPATAQQAKTVADVTIRFGLVTALQAEHADAQHGTHKAGHGSGMEHLVVTLADARTGTRIGDASVLVEVTDPKGKQQSKMLQSMVTAGYPDYSEVFHFGWSGRYTIRMTILRPGAAKPLKATFTQQHAL
ncbi:MAG TPA: hypothetical protein VF876_03110 [Burkholderiales bacterium]